MKLFCLVTEYIKCLLPIDVRRKCPIRILPFITCPMQIGGYIKGYQADSRQNGNSSISDGSQYGITTMTWHKSSKVGNELLSG